MTPRHRSFATLSLITAIVAACGSSSDDAATPGATAGAAGASAGKGGATSAGAAGAAGKSGQGGVSAAGGAGSPAGQGGATAGQAGAGSAGASAGQGGAAPAGSLDMNDATILVPLPAKATDAIIAKGTDVAADGTALVPQALFDRLVAGSAETFNQPILPPETRDQLHVVAVRFDLCDRPAPGVCPASDDARMRVVFQPMNDSFGALDVGFHAFYRIANAEIPEALAAVRALAATATVQQSGALRMSPELTASPSGAYATKLRAFLTKYGGDTRIVRLTVNAQPLVFAQIRWMLRGVELKGGAFVDMGIVGSTAVEESVLLAGAAGSPGFDVKPAADAPVGLAVALSESAFAGANDKGKRDALAALVAVENPLSHSAETVACVACHTSTVLSAARAAALGVDLQTVPGRYTSTRDLSVAGGKSNEADRTLRALGYLGKTPMISQRVVNDTAQTLAEIEQRFPTP